MSDTKPTRINVRLSGAICGHTWMPQTMAGLLGDWSVTSQRNRIVDPDDPNYRASIARAIESIITENGGDFQDAEFAADTQIILEYRKPTTTGYVYRCFTRDVSECPSLTDYVNQDAYVSDFMGEY